MAIKRKDNILRVLLAGLTLSVALSCSDGFSFTDYPCRVVIDNSIHQDISLASAMNAASPGVFCTISVSEGRKQYTFRNNIGQETTVNFNAVDERASRIVGMNNAIIIGYGTLSGEFMAFDRECPMCFDPNAVPVRSRPLNVDGTGTAQCSSCSRKYDINNYGICISEGGGKGMNRYRCSTTGPFGILSVTNR